MSRSNNSLALKLPLLDECSPTEIFQDIKLNLPQHPFKPINNEQEQFQNFSPTQKKIMLSVYKKDEKFFGEDFFACLKRSDSIYSQSGLRDASPIHLIEVPVKANPVFDEIHYNTFRNKKLANLFDCLMKIFLHDQSAFDKKMLSRFEGLLLMNIVQRKFGLTDQQNMQSFLTELCRRLESHIHVSSTKRKEENIKFIYKMILKKMKRQFEEQHHLPKDENNKFYQNYFGSLSNSLQVPIHDFYDPSNSDKMRGKVNTNNHFKSINTEFLQLVFRSDVFKAEFRAHLLSPEFLLEYQKKLHKKIDKMLLRWSKLVDKLPIEVLEIKANEYFRKSVRCKLPWSVFEVLQANRYFATLL